jgi:hypothetical protein
MNTLYAPIRNCSVAHDLTVREVLVTVRGEHVGPDGNIWAYGEQASITIQRTSEYYFATSTHPLLSVDGAITALKNVFSTIFKEVREHESNTSL